jgi:hypothetical protein
MNEPTNTPMFDSTPPAPEPFYQVWLKAVTRPNEQTYADLVSSPGANPNKAYLWLALSYVFSFFVVMLVSSVSTSTQYGGRLSDVLGSSLIALICAAPISAVIGVLFYAIETAIVQWVANLFKGTGTYSQLIYAFAAFTAPISIVSSVISLFSLIPFIGLCFSIISIGVGIYALVLMIMAVKGVNKFGWGEAAGSVLIPGLVVVFLCACVTIGVLMLLGPVIGDVFSTINQSLGY